MLKTYKLKLVGPHYKDIFASFGGVWKYRGLFCWRTVGCDMIFSYLFGRGVSRSAVATLHNQQPDSEDMIVKITTLGGDYFRFSANGKTYSTELNSGVTRILRRACINGTIWATIKWT